MGERVKFLLNQQLNDRILLRRRKASQGGWSDSAINPLWVKNAVPIVLLPLVCELSSLKRWAECGR